MSVDFSTLSLTDLLAKRTEIDTQLALKTGGAVVNATGKKGKKEKKQSKRAGKPTVYGAFSSKIQKEHADEIKAYKEANPEMKGAHMSFVGTYKKEHDEEYKAFEAEWREAHPKDAVESSPEDAEVGDSASSSGQPVAAEKPKRVLSPEHLAKLKAGREAAKAKKDAEKATSEEAGKSESDVAPAATVPKKQPKKAKKADAPAPAPVAAPEPTPAPEPVAAPAEENDDAPEFLPFKFGGLQYLRLGTKREDGNHLWATGDLWASKKGVKGAYVGCITESGEIDTDAEEPTVE
jgi:hypothetical protein